MNVHRMEIFGIEMNFFAKHLLKHIGKPNKDIHRLFRTVANGVCIESKQTQKPKCINGFIQSDQIYLNEK